MATIDNQVDEFGNLWVSDLPVRSDLSSAEFLKRFSNYSTIAVDSNSDQVHAAGNSMEALEKGFLLRSLNPNDYQLEPVL